MCDILRFPCPMFLEVDSYVGGRNQEQPPKLSAIMWWDLERENKSEQVNIGREIYCVALPGEPLEGEILIVLSWEETTCAFGTESAAAHTTCHPSLFYRSWELGTM